MDDKEAIEILTRMLEEHVFSEKEKQAVLTAIGILSWSTLGQTRIKNIIKSQKAKRGLDFGDKKEILPNNQAQL